jgi:hypothetical protein
MGRGGATPLAQNAGYSGGYSSHLKQQQNMYRSNSGGSNGSVGGGQSGSVGTGSGSGLSWTPQNRAGGSSIGGGSAHRK